MIHVELPGPPPELVEKGALELETSGPNPRLEGLLFAELQTLARFVDPEHEYSAVAKAIVDPVLEELTA